MQISETLVDIAEIQRYDEAVNAVQKGQLNADRFMAFRLQHGVYGQRQEGVHMVRIKVPGGRLNSLQLRKVAEAVARYSRQDHVQVTTRQDLQAHFIPLADTPKFLATIAEAGLTTREACGNTVRNMTACPLAGICPNEHTDVQRHLDVSVRQFLRHPLTQHLPRKFKISFSGCEQDCAMGLMHDVGVVATRRDQQVGFKILAGGGLGHKPREAVVVRDFVPESDLLPAIEAAIALHNRYSDRKRRAKARLKFLVDRFGRDGFVARYDEEYARTKVAYADRPSPRAPWQQPLSSQPVSAGAPRQTLGQKQPGLFIVPIALPRGDITVDQLNGLAALLERHPNIGIRSTVDQNLILTHVSEAQRQDTERELAALGLRQPVAGDDVVTCPGTTTCRLGITASKLVAEKLHGGPLDLRIRVSGCHNSCGQHHVADIGIHGEGKRIHGKLIPCYVLHLGGDGKAGGTIARKGPVVPAMRIVPAIERLEQAYARTRAPEQTFFEWSRNHDPRYFNDLLADLIEVKPQDIATLARDHGEDTSFQVLQLGGGECAGAAQDFVAASFAEALHERAYRQAFVLQRKYSEAIECALEITRLVSASLLFLLGEKNPPALREAAAVLQRRLQQTDPQFSAQMEQIVTGLEALTGQFDNDAFAQLAEQQDRWMFSATQLCLALDQQLDLTTATGLLDRRNTAASGIETVDLSGYDCPLHYIKARNTLKNQPEGTRINFIVQAGEAAEKVSGSLKHDGHRIIQQQTNGTLTTLTIEKAALTRAAS